MSKRTNQILAGVLLLQITLGVIVFWPSSNAAEAQPLLPDVTAEDVTGISVMNAEEEQILVEKVNGEWVLPQADNYPVREEKAPNFLEKVLNVTTERLVTRTESSQKRLQVDDEDFQRLVTLYTTDSTYAFYIGSSPSYGRAHVRLQGESETYLTDEISSSDASVRADAWVDTQYVSVDPNDVVRMTLENPNGEFVFEQDDDGWSYLGLGPDEEVNETMMQNVVFRASSITLLRPLGKEEKEEYGLDDPTAVVTLETEEKTVTLTIGGLSENDYYYIKSSESPYYVEASKNILDSNLINKTHEDFIKEPPTPTPENGGE